MAHKEKTLSLHHVHLDSGNPRHAPIDNELDIIHKLVMMEGVRPLAEDIAKWGLNPLEKMGVVPHPSIRDKYIAAEGNRRLCAMKLLVDPEKAPDERSRKVFRELKKKHPLEDIKLEVVVFDSEEEARHWVELRHRGPQEGKGTKPWNANQKARFDAKSKHHNPNALALLLLDYAVDNGLVDENHRKRLSLTTLTRYLSNRVVRDALGLASPRKLVRTAADKSQFDRGIKRFLDDGLDTGENALSSRTNSAEREAYANRLRKRGYSPKKRVTEPIDVDNSSQGPDTGKTARREIRELIHPGKRRNVVPTTFKVQINDNILRRIYIELKSIDAAVYPFSATYLFRAFVELVVKRYCKKHGLGIQRNALDAAIGRATEHLTSQGVSDRVLKPLRVMANDKDAFYSPDSIGNVIHGGAVAQRKDVNAAWDNVESGLLELINRL